MKPNLLYFLLLSLYLAPVLATEHNNHLTAMQGIFGSEDFTHTAIADGQWFDSNTCADS